MKTRDLFKSPMSDIAIDNEQLIQEVKAMPCLYDLNANEYKNKHLKTNSWHIIAGNIAGPKWAEMRQYDRIKLEKDIQKRWKSLRDAFARNVKVNSLADFTSSKKKSTYVYAKHMNFLLNFITRRSAPCIPYHDANSMHMMEDLDDHEILDDEKDEEVTVAGADEDKSILQTIPSVSCNDSPTILRFSTRSSEDVEHEVVNTSTPRSTTDVSSDNYSNDQNDPDRMFLLSLLPYFGKLRPSDKLDVQIQFMQILKSHVDPS